MTNPFNAALDDAIRGRRVEATGEHTDKRFAGWVDRIHHHERHLLLRGAVDLDGSVAVGSVFIANATEVVVIEDDETERIERVALDDIEDAPYHTREFTESANRGYVGEVRDTGFVGSYPVVRPVWTMGDDGPTPGDTYEVVEGHKRLWACRQAGLDSHPVVIDHVDDWTAARRFAADHYPDPGQVDDGDDGTATGAYDDEALAASLLTFLDEWGERALELDRVWYNAERLGLEHEALPDFEVTHYDPADALDVDPYEHGDFAVGDRLAGRPDTDDSDDGGDA